MILGGPLPLQIERAFSSYGWKRDVGLGPGWSHSLAMEVEVRATSIWLWTPDGQAQPFDVVEAGGMARRGTRELERHERGFILRDGGLTRRFEHVVDDRYLLTSESDRYGNAFHLTYDDAHLLTSVTDCVGRELRVRRHSNGQIAAFEVKNAPSQGVWVAFVRYDYDAQRRLVAVTDAIGHVNRFRYDGDTLVAAIAPTGRTTHYRYDGRRRCVETWVDYATQIDPALDRDVPRVLADGSPAHGMMHLKMLRYDDFIEVINSKEVRTLMANEHGLFDMNVLGGGVATATYDDQGDMASYTDAEAATWSWRKDEFGRTVGEVDPLGNEASWTYGERGYLTTSTDAAGWSRTYHRNVQGDVLFVTDDLGPLIEYRYDERGLITQVILPNGATTTMRYDDMGNRIEVHEPNGGVRQIRYDYFGRVAGFVNELGGETRYQRDDCGKITAVRWPDGHATRYEYDGNGQTTAFITPNGRRYELSWAGFDHVHEVRRPDATTVKFGYDREGHMTRVVNHAGEEFLVMRDVAGRVIGERTFDGRQLSYRVDMLGRTTRYGTDLGSTEVVYDAIGRVVERNYEDGSSETFEWDASGQLIASSNGVTRCTFEYDPRGNLIAEVQEIEGVAHRIDHVFDQMGHRTELRTSLGHVQRMAYDAMGLPAAIDLDDNHRLSLTHDLCGHEIERRLPGGGCVTNEYDRMGNRTRRDVKSTRAMALGQRYAYDAEGSLLGLDESDLGRTDFEYTTLQRILSRVPANAAAEVFTYDAAANVAERGETRSYQPGGVLVRRDGTTWERDRFNRVTCKRSAEGQWNYSWDARGLLKEVERPDGARVAFQYDAFARRLLKRIVRRDGTVAVAARFVWSADQLVHDVRTTADVRGDEVIEERTYAMLPRTLQPLAERRTTNGVDGSWRYHVTDDAGRPEALVDDDGVVERMQYKTFGELASDTATTTPFRFAGHFADDDVGLFYNRYRYYDPSTAQYLSPEPWGLAGGLLGFAYAENNPLEVIDIDGLKGMKSKVTGDGITTERGSSSTEGKSSADVKDGLHPVVKDALVSGQEKSYGKDRDGAACAEPRAVSDYLYEYEKKHKIKPPGSLKGKKLKDALSKMEVGANQADASNKPRAPCRNCSQFFANLAEKHGAPKESQIKPGATAHNAKAEDTRFQPPKPGKSGHQTFPTKKGSKK
jgi:RHS repeat-associated protein